MRPPEPGVGHEPAQGRRRSDSQSWTEKVVHIPTRKVGYLIGHHGRTISGFESKSGAKIDILKPNSRDSETPVLITGPAECVRLAIRLLMDLYSFHNFSSRMWLCLGPQEAIRANEEVIMAPEFVQFLLDCDLVNRIEEETQSLILITRGGYDRDTAPDAGVPLNVIGSVDSITGALGRLRAELRSFSSRHLNRFQMAPDQNRNISIVADNPYKKFGRRYTGYEEQRSGRPGEPKGTCCRMDVTPHRFLHHATSPDDADAAGQVSIVVCLSGERLNEMCKQLQPICKQNNVAMEIFALDHEAGGTQDASVRSRRRNILIRGLDQDARKARLELLQLVERYQLSIS